MTTRKPRRPAAVPIDSPDRRRLPPLLRRAWYGLNQAFRRRIAHLDLTPDQFTALRTLLEAGDTGLSQSDLTRHMSSDPNTVASLVERMRKAGLIVREPHEGDRRRNRLRLNPEGHGRYIEARAIAVSLQQEVLACLRESERSAFLRELTRVADACRLAADASPRGKR